MVKEGGSDVVKMPKEGEETAPQLVVPHLYTKRTFTQLSPRFHFTVVH